MHLTWDKHDIGEKPTKKLENKKKTLYRDMHACLGCWEKRINSFLFSIIDFYL